MHRPDDAADSAGAKMVRELGIGPGLDVDDPLVERAREELELDEDAERSEGA